MTLSRRNSIKVIGAGVIVAAAGAAIAVPRLDAMPATAVEGWSGPPSAERDPRRRALAFALLAPSPHNLQSWLVDLSRDGEVLLFVDGGRLLPQTDPLSRQILIGQGCFLEILSMAAAAEGWRTETSFFRPARGPSSGRLHASSSAACRRPSVDPLFAQVPRRRTVKGRFEPRPLDAAHGNALLTGVDLHGLRLSIVDEPARVERLRAIAIAGSELEMNTPRTHKESIDVVRIGSAEIAAHRDGISIKGPMIWMLRQLGEMTPAQGDDAGHHGLEQRPRLCPCRLCQRAGLRLAREHGQRQGDPGRCRARLGPAAARGGRARRRAATAQPDLAGVPRDGGAACRDARGDRRGKR